jgi:hypothetical protein
MSSSLVAQTAVQPPDEYCAYGARPCPLYQPSLIYLLANPQEFEGRRVRVVGFMHLEFEGTAIYVRRDDYESSLTRNGFWLSFRDSTVNRTGLNTVYVILEGTFTGKSGGHLGLWSGTIRDVSFLARWPSGRD